MKSAKAMVVIVGGVLLLLVVAFGLTWGGIEWYRFFGPKAEGARREVFEKTRSYNQGKIQQLSKLRLEYLRSNSETERAAIRSTIRHQFADFDRNQLPAELHAFTQGVFE